jgi:hypothetical protein
VIKTRLLALLSTSSKLETNIVLDIQKKSDYCKILYLPAHNFFLAADLQDVLNVFEPKSATLSKLRVRS